AIAGTGTGNNNNLRAGDALRIDLDDTFWPQSIRPDWDATLLTGTAVLREGSRDYFNPNADFGLSMFVGSAYNQGINLNATNWTTSTSYAGSTFGRFDRTTLQLTLGGTSSVTVRNAQMQIAISQNVRDAAGNPSTGNYTFQCQSNPW
ncbi:MAG: hypothetical protein JWO69_541, partial [Thermoleophilia bacterium]|nr:hypothetical protein [Thermoleophilia bacterium]